MPLKVLILALFHHCLSFTMIIPCNMSRAGEEIIYAKIIFVLSIGAGSALLLR